MFLVLLLSQPLLLLLIFLIRVRLGLRHDVPRDLVRMIVGRAVVCFRPIAGIWRPVCIGIFRAIVRRQFFVYCPVLIPGTIRGISSAVRVVAAVRWRIVIAAGTRSYYSASAKRRRSCRSRDRRFTTVL